MFENIELIALLNFVTSFLMMGVIITTQIVNYPLFLSISKNDFNNFHSKYVNKITAIVMPLMITELILSIILLISIQNYMTILIFTTMSLIFISTIFIQVPIHKKIEKEANKNLLNKLIQTNWIRTILWFIKSSASYNLIKGLL